MSAFLSVILVTGLLVMMLLGMVGVQNVQKSKPLQCVVFAFFFFGVLYVLGVFEFVSKRSLVNYFLPAVLLFALFVALVWGVLKGLLEKKKTEEQQVPKKASEKKKKVIRPEQAGDELSEEEIRDLLQQANEIGKKIQNGESISSDERLKLLTARGIMAQMQEAQRRAQEQQTPAQQLRRR